MTEDAKSTMMMEGRRSRREGIDQTKSYFGIVKRGITDISQMQSQRKREFMFKMNTHLSKFLMAETSREIYDWQEDEKHTSPIQLS